MQLMSQWFLDVFGECVTQRLDEENASITGPHSVPLHVFHILQLSELETSMISMYCRFLRFPYGSKVCCNTKDFYPILLQHSCLVRFMGFVQRLWLEKIFLSLLLLRDFGCALFGEDFKTLKPLCFCFFMGRGG